MKRNNSTTIIVGRKEEARIRAEEKIAREKQNQLEKGLDKVVASAMLGVANIRLLTQKQNVYEYLSTLAKTDDVFTLYAAFRNGGSAWQATISGEMADGKYIWGVLSPRDQGISIAVDLRQDAIVLSVDVSFYGYFIHGGDFKDGVQSVWELEIPIEKPSKEQWDTTALHIRKLALADMSSPWRENGVFYHEEVPEGLTQNIINSQPILAGDRERTVLSEYEWLPNHVLLRFLTDCSRPASLKKYLLSALDGISR